MNRKHLRQALLGICVFLASVSMAYALDTMCYALPGSINASIPLYRNAVEAGWDALDTGGVALIDESSTPSGKVGNYALKLLFETWGMLELKRELPISTVGKRALVFRVRGVMSTSGLDQLHMGVVRNGGIFGGWLPITNYMVSTAGGVYSVSTWYTVTIPLEDLGISDVSLESILFMAGSNLVEVFLDEIWLVQGLEFPLKDETAYTAKISSAFDHVSSQSEFNCRDEWVVAYSGEVGHSNNGESEWQTDATGSSCVGEFLRGYAQDINNGDHTPFSLNGQYDTDGYDQEEGKFLFYDGHTGYDYPKVAGTSVYSVASGTVSYASGSLVVVDHQNGYTSHYEHMTNLKVSVDTKVTTDTKLGEVASGTNHLHLSIKLYDVRVDPYGWSGGFTDPSRPFAVNVPLWK